MAGQISGPEYRQTQLEKALDFGETEEDIRDSPQSERLFDYREFLLERVEGRTGFMETLTSLSVRDLEKLYTGLVGRSPREDFRSTTRFR